MSGDFVPGQPFVSISSVNGSAELWEVGQQKDLLDFETSLPLVIGWQISNSSINRGTRNPRQPPFSDIGGLTELTYDFGMIPAFHYFTKDMNEFPRDVKTLVEKLNGIDGPKLFQFNTIPPSREYLETSKSLGFSNIFKVPVADKESAPKFFRSDYFEDVRDADVPRLIQSAYDVHDLTDYVMFDASNGIGVQVDLSENSVFSRFSGGILAHRKLNHLGIVLAGGLGPYNISRTVEECQTNFTRRISFDSESGVRKMGDVLDSRKAREYLEYANDAYFSKK